MFLLGRPSKGSLPQTLVDYLALLLLSLDGRPEDGSAFSSLFGFVHEGARNYIRLPGRDSVVSYSG